jgi:putative Holliday junction resolvase
MVQSKREIMKNIKKTAPAKLPARILAIDYGKKRWGLAFCDELRVVFTLPALIQMSFNERLENLRAIVKERRISRLVLGLPITLEGNKSQLTIEVERFAKEILTPFGLPITFVDEALSSYVAEASLPKEKIKKGFQKRDGTVDSKAAALILEDYLSQHPEHE